MCSLLALIPLIGHLGKQQIDKVLQLFLCSFGPDMKRTLINMFGREKPTKTRVKHHRKHDQKWISKIDPKKKKRTAQKKKEKGGAEQLTQTENEKNRQSSPFNMG